MQGLKVLVIDDEPDARELIESVLSQQGVEVRCAVSVSGAFSELENWTPAVILSDIDKPDEDGFDFIRRLNEFESSAGRRLPVVALTAYTRPEDRAKVLSAGFVKHISKPIDSNELIELVTSLVED